MIIVRLQSREWVTGAASVQDHWFADVGLTTRANDYPANTYIAGRLFALPRLVRRLGGPLLAGSGGFANSTGELVLDNQHDSDSGGNLDHLLVAKLAAMPVAVYDVPDDPVPVPLNVTSYPVLAATAGRQNLSESAVELPLRSAMEVLAEPFLARKFMAQQADGSQLPLDDALDADAQLRLANARVPLVLGRVLNISPVLVDTVRQIYCLSADRTTELALFDQGVALTFEGTVGSVAALQAAAVSAGHYKVFRGDLGSSVCSYVRLGSPATALTADCESTSGNTVGWMLEQVLAAKLEADQYDARVAGGVFDLVAGVLISEEISTLDVLQLLCQTVDAWYGVIADGRLRVAAFPRPAVTSLAPAVTDADLLVLPETENAQDSRRAGSLIFRFNRNYTVQTSLAGSPAASRLALLNTEWQHSQTAVLADADFAPGQQDVLVDTALRTDVPADLDGFKVEMQLKYLVSRNYWTLRMDRRRASALGIELGERITVYWSRLGFQHGRPLVVTGMETDLSDNTVTLTAWG